MLAIVSPSGTAALTIGVASVVAFGAIRVATMLPHRHRSVRSGPVSGLVDSKKISVAIGAVVAVIVLAGVGLIVGDFPIPAVDAIRTALWDRGGEFDFIVNTLRFPRVSVAILAGICLAMSGAIFQSLIDNPLVSPDIIGINSGAALVAVSILAVGGDINFLAPAAFAGATLTALLIYVLAWRRGVSSARLVLIGIGINALLTAGITFITVRFPIERIIAAARWQAGSLFGATWEDARTLAIGLLVLGPLSVYLMQRLRLLQLGDDVAKALGSRVERDRLALLFVGSLLAALAVAVVGPLAFVALLVPHMVRLILGNMTTGVLIATGLFGGFFLLASDLIAQRLFAPVALPAGVVTSALGGPYFLYLLARYNRAL